MAIYLLGYDKHSVDSSESQNLNRWSRDPGHTIFGGNSFDSPFRDN